MCLFIKEIIQELIESLDESQSPMECIEYYHFVNEDDYATLAAETAIQMVRQNHHIASKIVNLKSLNYETKFSCELD